MPGVLAPGTTQYVLTLPCGCAVNVICEPGTRMTRTRVIERKGERCPARTHQRGARVYLWEMLPARVPFA